jgi:hypothetical protein
MAPCPREPSAIAAGRRRHRSGGSGAGTGGRWGGCNDKREREGEREGGEGVAALCRWCKSGGQADGRGDDGRTSTSVTIPCYTNTDPRLQNPVPNRRGFDSLLDAGFTPTEIAAMRREFYLSRGQEVPDEFVATGGTGDGYEEHVRALEEQWIEGDLNNETAESEFFRRSSFATC